MGRPSNESSVEVKVRAGMVDKDKFKNSSDVLTLSWSTNSNNIQVQGPGGFLYGSSPFSVAGIAGDEERREEGKGREGKGKRREREEKGKRREEKEQEKKKKEKRKRKKKSKKKRTSLKK